MKKYILFLGLVLLTILAAQTEQDKHKNGVVMSNVELKEELLDNLDTNRKYYLVNKKEKKYNVLYLEMTKNKKYKLEEVFALSYAASPLEYESKQTHHQYADKIKLYDGISTILDKLLDADMMHCTLREMTIWMKLMSIYQISQQVSLI